MALITLAQAKEHCRVTNDLEDATMQIYVDAVEEHIKNYLNTKNVPQKSPIKAAALLLVQDLYENRSAQAEVDLKENRAACNLLYPYRQNIGV